MGEDDTDRIIVPSLTGASPPACPHALKRRRASPHPVERDVCAAYDELKRAPVPTRLLALLDAAPARKPFH